MVGFEYGEDADVHNFNDKYLMNLSIFFHAKIDKCIKTKTNKWLCVVSIEWSSILEVFK